MGCATSHAPTPVTSQPEPEPVRDNLASRAPWPLWTLHRPRDHDHHTRKPERGDVPNDRVPDHLWHVRTLLSARRDQNWYSIGCDELRAADTDRSGAAPTRQVHRPVHVRSAFRGRLDDIPTGPTAPGRVEADRRVSGRVHALASKLCQHRVC